MKRLLQISLLCLLMIMSTTALANMPEKPINQSQTKVAESLNDGASLLKSNEVQQLNSKINKLESKYGVRIAIVTTPTIKNQETMFDSILNSAVGKTDEEIEESLMAEFTENLQKTRFNDGKNGNIVLAISMDIRKWHITTDGLMNQKINYIIGLQYLENAFLTKLSSGDYYGAFDSYVNTIDELLTYYEQNGEPFDPYKGFNPLAAIAAVVISIFIGTMIRSSLIASMSNVRPAVEASEYLDKNTFQLTENRDTFLYMNVQRRPNSHGGGGHNSGGNSSGGGGRGGSF